MDKKMMTIDLNSKVLLDKAERDGVETMYDRKQNFKAQCGFGLQGNCCRICGMGPCRITPKTPRGLCGADEHVIVGRNFARMVAGGTAAHSDHARDIAHTMALASRNGNYTIKDESKLITLAKEWDVETEGRDIYDIAHEVADVALMEFGKPYGVARFLKNAPVKRQKVWKELGIEPRAIDREVATIMHSTHIGCTADIDSLIHMSLRTSLADGLDL